MSGKTKERVKDKARKAKKAVKDKVKAKAKATKGKVKGKLKTLVALLALGALFAGCSTATPASRATSANYEITVKVSVDEKAHATVNVPVKLGDGAIASADSSGSTETQTATPTLDIKPDVNVNYAQGGGISTGGGRAASGAAGILEQLTSDGLATLKDYLTGKKSGTVTLQKTDGSTVTATCADGSCTFTDGTTATASDCENCTAK